MGPVSGWPSPKSGCRNCWRRVRIEFRRRRTAATPAPGSRAAPTRRAIRGASRRCARASCSPRCATGCRRAASSTAASPPSRTGPTACPCASRTARLAEGSVVVGADGVGLDGAAVALARRRAGGGFGLVSAGGIAERGFGDEALAFETLSGRLALCARAALGRRLLLVCHAAGDSADASSLEEAYAGWHAPIPEVLRAAADDELRWERLQSVAPLDAWSTGRAVLVGDAAHALPINLAQGAAAAIEGAYLLGTARRAVRRRPRGGVPSVRGGGRPARCAVPPRDGLHRAARRAGGPAGRGRGTRWRSCRRPSTASSSTRSSSTRWAMFLARRRHCGR